MADASGGPRLPAGPLRDREQGWRGRGLELRGARGRLLPAAPCRLPGLRAPSRRGCQDSRFPAARGAGRFQPQPIFGESLSRLRHPALGGGGGGGPRSGPATARPPRCCAAPALGPRAAGPRLWRACGHAGAGSPPQPSPSPHPGRRRGPPRAAWEVGWERSTADCVTFPVHPTVDSSSQRGSELARCARLRGYAQARGVWACVSEGGVCSDIEPTRERGHGIDSGEKSQRAWVPLSLEAREAGARSLFLSLSHSPFLSRSSVSSLRGRAGRDVPCRGSPSSAVRLPVAFGQLLLLSRPCTLHQ